MNIKIFIISIVSIFLFLGCAGRNMSSSSEFNKPAIYWYKSIIKKINFGDLEAAADYYTSLASEHINSPFLKESMLILAQAHADEEEYMLANYYLDEYIKRFGTGKNIEFLSYLKIKSNFDSFKHQNRDQKLLMDTIASGNRYIKKYPNSSYLPLVKTMLTKLYISEYILNKNIATLYAKLGKDKSEKIYREKLENSWLKNTKIINPDKIWIRKIFE